MLGFLSNFMVASWLTFASPVHYPISLAGNFGEPRPNHFHGGIDIRTGMVEGKPLFAVADGYVSRVTVGLYGFGNALYITHPGGVTSVYCHLKKFTPQVQALVRKWQYRHKTCFADMHLRPTDCPVAVGDLVAVSGNTGASRAPHLHLEFHDTRTWSMLDPLKYLKTYVTDTTKPIAHSFMAYPKEGKGVFCGSSNKQSYGFSSLNLTRKFTAWGKVGFGIWANDYMDGSFGILGVRNTKLIVDGRKVFESDVDSIPEQCNRMVNSWGDYDHYGRTNVWYMKSFVEPGNTIPVLHVDENKGYVDFNQEREYHIEYIITDVFGNSRSYTFTVEGRRQTIPATRGRNFLNIFRYDRFNHFQRPGMSLNVYRGLLPDDVELKPQVIAKQGALSDTWNFMPKSYPLFNFGKLSLKLKHPAKHTDKLYIVSHYGVDRYMGGRYNDGWVTAPIRELGARYEIEYDDTPPVVSGFNASAKRLSVALYDAKSGLDTFECYVDGRFVLFELVDKSNMYICDLAETPVKRTGGTHKLVLTAIDKCHNKKIFTTQFKY